MRVQSKGKLYGGWGKDICADFCSLFFESMSRGDRKTEQEAYSKF